MAAVGRHSAQALCCAVVEKAWQNGGGGGGMVTEPEPLNLSIGLSLYPPHHSMWEVAGEGSRYGSGRCARQSASRREQHTTQFTNQRRYITAVAGRGGGYARSTTTSHHVNNAQV